MRPAENEGSNLGKSGPFPGDEAVDRLCTNDLDMKGDAREPV
jgi:hypothetical protein